MQDKTRRMKQERKELGEYKFREGERVERGKRSFLKEWVICFWRRGWMDMLVLAAGDEAVSLTANY